MWLQSTQCHIPEDGILKKNAEIKNAEMRKASLYMFAEDGASLNDAQLDSISVSVVFTLCNLNWVLSAHIK
jgi:hypothetical protein